jgi:8-oxo-dGTP pyrophosphatase MutT (NUDIX family)
MNKKILSFITDGRRFLALRNNAQDLSHGGDFWFTVAGSIELKESLEEAVKREIKEETNLEIKEIFSLNWGSIYSWDKKDNSEKNFLAFVKKGEIVLNEEHVEFAWLNLEDFIKRIKWDLSKDELNKVLEKALKKELFFKEEKIEDFRVK